MLTRTTWEAGFGRYTGTVTAATPLTFGASSFGVGGCDYGTWACYEVPSSGGGTPSVDASSPALASATGPGIKTVTSASLHPAGRRGRRRDGRRRRHRVVRVVRDGGLRRRPDVDPAGRHRDGHRPGHVRLHRHRGGSGAVQPPQPQPGSRNWRLRHRRRQQIIPAALAGQPVAGAATLAGSGSISTAAVQSAGATLAGTGSIAASPGPPVITGLAGGANGYFADQGGNPRLVWGDAVWALSGNVGRWSSGAWQADYDTYFATRAAQGVTVLYTKPMGTTSAGTSTTTAARSTACARSRAARPAHGANPSARA